MQPTGVPDRRRRRSQNQLWALNELLEHARARHGLGSIVLADDAGCVIAGAGPAWRCAELAATAPLARFESTQGAPLELGSMQCFLRTNEPANAGIFADLSDGCRRILRYRPSA